jgi:hypothetical protein
MIPGLKHSVANLEAANAPAVVRVHAPTNQVATAIFIAVIVRVVAVIGVRSPAKSEKDMPVEPVMEAASASAETAKATAMEAATAAKMAATSAAMAAATTTATMAASTSAPAMRQGTGRTGQADQSRCHQGHSRLAHHRCPLPGHAKFQPIKPRQRAIISRTKQSGYGALALDFR